MSQTYTNTELPKVAKAEATRTRQLLLAEIDISPKRKVYGEVCCTFETRLKSNCRQVMKKSSSRTCGTAKTKSQSKAKNANAITKAITKPSSLPVARPRPLHYHMTEANELSPNQPALTLRRLEARHLPWEDATQDIDGTARKLRLAMLQTIATGLRPNLKAASPTTSSSDLTSDLEKPLSATTLALNNIDKFAVSFLQGPKS